MNKQPVSYLQKDPRWKDKPYRVPGENSTIGSAGCGPTCAAMVIQTLTGKTFTPEDACLWSVKHGYKALKQGTYYSYFKAQLAAFAIDCDLLSWTSTYGKPNHENHKRALDMLQQGYYLIALMNKGTWTSAGHYILVWWADGKIRINDPASTKDSRVNGDPYDFRSQVKYYWWVDARKHNMEDDIMTGSEIINALTDEQAYNLLAKAQRHATTLPEPKWSQQEGHWQRATAAGIVNGEAPEGLMKRDELAAVLGRKDCCDAVRKDYTMKKYNTIEITLGNGHSVIWEADKGEWDDYSYDGAAFIIKKDGAWVGIYNMNHVISVVVK